MEYPVTVDMTPRRLQRFKLRPGQEVRVAIGDSVPQTLTADESGLITVRAIRIPSGDGVRLTITP